MSYLIGEVADSTGIAVSTLRYYDKEGLFPFIRRSDGGIRVFTETEIGAIEMIECLKATGMPIKDIKQFVDWCQEGDDSLQKRLDMFKERLDAVTKQMADLQRTMDTIKYKCWYYSVAVAAGCEDTVRNISDDEMPAEIRRCKDNYKNG